MSIKTRTYTSTHTTLTDDEGREFELPIAGETYDYDALVSDLEDGRVLVSYMVSDEDSSGMDPRDDCNGWQEFRVLDSQRDADELSHLLNDCTCCGYHYNDHLDDDGNMRTDLDAWINCDGWTEPPAMTAVKAGRAFLFEKYEHGMVRYALRGESSMVDRQWDVSPVAGFMWADDDWGKTVDIEQAARNFLETFTDWCNGDVWGIVHAWFSNCNEGWMFDNEESCWGFIGSEYAEQTLREEHESYKEAK